MQASFLGHRPLCASVESRQQCGPVPHPQCVWQGAVPGCKKRLVTLRRSMFTPTSRTALEAINLKFIDTASKIGHGRFQQSSEKARTLGRVKETAA